MTHACIKQGYNQAFTGATQGSLCKTFVNGGDQGDTHKTSSWGKPNDHASPSGWEGWLHASFPGGTGLAGGIT